MESKTNNNTLVETPEEKLKRFIRERYDYVPLNYHKDSGMETDLGLWADNGRAFLFDLVKEFEIKEGNFNDRNYLHIEGYIWGLYLSAIIIRIFNGKKAYDEFWELNPPCPEKDITIADLERIIELGIIDESIIVGKPHV